MEIRLYIDEDAMSRALVRGLRSRGIDVTTVNEEEMAGQGDTTQLEYALQKERVFYTFTWVTFVVCIGSILPGANPIRE
jgi:uncharacterized protein DUF5615